MFRVENTFGFILRWPDGISCREYNGETKSVKRIQSMKENGGVCLLHEFRSENSASLRRVTPSTQVGRLSESHFEICFQLTQFPGKMAMEPKGERVGALEDVSTIVCAHLQFTNARQLKAAEGKRLGGKYRGTTMETNKERVESQLVEKFSQVHG